MNNAVPSCFCAPRFARRTASGIATGAWSRASASPAGASFRSTFFISARSTTRRNWRGAGRSRCWTKRPIGRRRWRCFPKIAATETLPDASIVRLKLSQLRLCRPRQWGACWLALSLWEELRLDRFWAERLPASRKGTRWDQELVRAGRLSVAGAGQRVAAASGVVRADRARRSAGRRFRARRDPQALSLSRPAAGAQGGAVRSSDGPLARPVRRALRSPALRSDQHVFRGRAAVPGGRQATLRLFARSSARLRAGGDRAGGHARRSAARLRGSVGQHGGQDDAAGFSRQDRTAIRQGPAGLGDGPRHSHRGDAGRDARRPIRPCSTWSACRRDA